MCVSCVDSELPTNGKIPPFTSLACSTFQRGRAVTHDSGNQAFVLPQRGADTSPSSSDTTPSNVLAPPSSGGHLVFVPFRRRGRSITASVLAGSRSRVFLQKLYSVYIKCQTGSLSSPPITVQLVSAQQSKGARVHFGSSAPGTFQLNRFYQNVLLTLQNVSLED